MHRKKLCFVTEIDLDKGIGGAIINDMKTLRCLRKFGDVKVIHFQEEKYRSTWTALLVFVLRILKSFSKPCQAYFSRGIVASFLLIFFRPIHHRKVIHRALSVPFASSEVIYLSSKVESFIFYCLFRFMEKIVLPNVDAITIASYDYADGLTRMGVTNDRIYEIPFYVEDDFFKQPLKSRVGKVFTFCYAGGFHQYHDLLPLIKAFQRACQQGINAELLLVGDGPLRPQIAKEVLKNKLTNKVRFLGKIPHLSMPSILSSVDCFMILTRKSGMSVSLLEAAAAGKAIITLKRRNDVTLSHYFRHLKEIYMIDEISPIEIAEAMKLLFANSKLRNTLSKGARKVAQQHFTESSSCGQVLILVHRICGDND